MPDEEYVVADEKESGSKESSNPEESAAAPPPEESAAQPAEPEPPPSTITAWVLRVLWKKKNPWLTGGVILVVLAGAVLKFSPPEYRRTVVTLFTSTTPASAGYPWCSDIAYPENYSNADFTILDRNTTVYLTAWHRVPQRIQATEKYSPVLFRNELRVRKVGNTRWFLRRHFTSGLPLDFASAQPWTACVATPDYGPGENQFSQYDVVFDVENKGVDTVFELDYNTTFWNSFQRVEREFVGVRISHPTVQVTFSVVFSFEPQGSQLTFQRSRAGDNNNRITESDPVYEIRDNIVTWVIKNPEIEWMYWLYWTWPN